MIDGAMEYEHLIRKAFNCGRHGINGADADIYRRFERNQRMYENNLKEIKEGKPRSWNQPIEKMAYTAGVNTGKVVANISNSIYKVKNDYYDELTDEQHEEIESLGVTLLEPTIENVEKVLKQAHQIFKELKLQAG